MDRRKWHWHPTSRRGVVALLLVVAVVATSAAIGQIWTRLRAIEYGYKISQAREENSRLREINRRLKVEVAVLKNPSRVAKIAEGHLGLVPPQPEQVRRIPRLEEGGSQDKADAVPQAQAVARVTP